MYDIARIYSPPRQSTFSSHCTSNMTSICSPRLSTIGSTYSLNHTHCSPAVSVPIYSQLKMQTGSDVLECNGIPELATRRMYSLTPNSSNENNENEQQFSSPRFQAHVFHLPEPVAIGGLVQCHRVTGAGSKNRSMRSLHTPEADRSRKRRSIIGLGQVRINIRERKDIGIYVQPSRTI